MDEIIISVIVPVYNVEKYLDECLQSILKQSFTKIELLLVDDGSHDDSLRICEEYAKKDFRVKVFHKSNGGQASARNLGLDKAVGSYIVFVDSDDVLSPNALKVLYEEMLFQQAEVVIGRIERFSPLGAFRPYHKLKEKKTTNGREVLKMLLSGKLLNITPCAMLFKSDIFKNLRFCEGLIFEDWYIMPHIFYSLKKVVYIPELVYLYRENSQSTMGGLMRKCNPQILIVAEHVINFVKENDLSLYYETLWSNVRRIWKYVGIVYLSNRNKQEALFLDQVRVFLKKYKDDLSRSSDIKLSEKIGLWSFCYCGLLCDVLYKIKKLR